MGQAGASVTHRRGRQCTTLSANPAKCTHILRSQREGRPVRGDNHSCHTPSWAGPQTWSLNTGHREGEVKYTWCSRACGVADVQECRATLCD